MTENSQPQQKPFSNKALIGGFLVLGIIASVVGIFIFGISLFVRPAQPAPETTTQSTQAVEKDLKIKGNRKSRIYHLPGCPNYNDIAERNIVWFKTTEEAEKAGYRIARNCG